MDESLLIIPLEGQINTLNAMAVGQEIARQRNAQKHRKLVFDAQNLTFVSSAGLRILLQVIKEEKVQRHEPVTIIRTSREVYDILEMTGLTKVVEAHRTFREISLEGCQLIGQGFFGQVFRLDEDTIVKVYAEGEKSIPRIIKEQSRAQKAFIKGIPTAISYDIVRVGNQYGAVFELLEAKSFNDYVRECEADQAKLNELMLAYVNCLKHVHATEMDKGELPLARDVMLKELSLLQDILPASALNQTKALLMALPDDLHVVHGDFQMKNVLFCHEDPMLIDMETLCTGQPLFDLQGLYVTYKAFAEDDPGNAMAFLGLHKETTDYIWQRLLELYFGTEDRIKLSHLEDKLRIPAAIRFLSLLTTNTRKDQELTSLRIRHTCEHLQELLSKVDSLDLQ